MSIRLDMNLSQEHNIVTVLLFKQSKCLIFAIKQYQKMSKSDGK